ncbi:putative thiol:disulfide interchange protein DsbC [Geobacter sp. OR-1]|uniref:DsbC family protein n=1 Tax=Geobacter sp. OR-1 TaxID=1266765 RepID=UPI000541C98B|nr:DsbC family protein [Geobacter sp. OR-1]GAM07854.1 putative thiol:disulfide interchange protein DsbC [Geobacter sp. OR-1]
MKLVIIAGLFLILSAATVTAFQQEEGCSDGTGHSGAECANCHKLGLDEAGKLLEGVGKVVSVGQSQVRGLFEVSLENQGKKGTAYVDYAKKHLIAGSIFSIAATQKDSGDNQVRAPLPKPAKVDINALPVKNSIILGNPDGKKRLFVFTDPDCPFCSKLHMELIKLIYMEPDLAIVVKMFPLKMHPGAYDKARVILGGDSSYLLNKAFSGEQLPPPGPKDAKEPVDESIKLGESLGITGTPTLVLPDGRILPGFKEAGEIKRLLDSK